MPSGDLVTTDFNSTMYWGKSYMSALLFIGVTLCSVFTYSAYVVTMSGWTGFM